MNALKLARVKKDLTMEQLGDKLFVSRQTISNWEHRKSKPTVTDIMGLHRVLDISLDEIMNFFDKKKKEEKE